VTSIEIHARAVLMDMDGTLVDSTAVAERLWSRWAVAHGLDPEHVLSVVHGRRSQDSMALLLPDRSAADHAADNREMIERETTEVDGIAPIPGAPALLAALATAPHALVTSAVAGLAAARMDAAGLPMPEIAVTAEKVAASKPDPEGFLTAAATLGVTAADCVVLEDSEAGVTAGLRAGMRVIGVGATATAHGATWTVPDLTHLTVATVGDGLRLTLL